MYKKTRKLLARTTTIISVLLFNFISSLNVYAVKGPASVEYKLNSISGSLEHTATIAEDFLQSANQLVSMSDELQDLIGQFKV